MTQVIDSSDPRYFTQSSNVFYDRHDYKIFDMNGDSVLVESWGQSQQLWWNTPKQFLSHIEVLDKPSKVKGFG